MAKKGWKQKKLAVEEVKRAPKEFTSDIIAKAHQGVSGVVDKRVEDGRFYSTKTAAARFEQKATLSTESDCLEWIGALDREGYAMFWFEGKTERAARFSFMQSKGPLEEGLEIDHLCKNRKCVNPSHLELVTHIENMRRRDATKLEKSDIGKIRQMSEAGKTQKEIGDSFGVSKTTIGDILRGITWVNEMQVPSLSGMALWKQLKESNFPQGGVGSWLKDPNSDEKYYIPHPAEIYQAYIADPIDWEIMSEAMGRVWLENKENAK